MNIKNLQGDISGGLMSALITIPMVIAYAAIIFAPLGPNFLPYGIVSVLIALRISNIISALFRGVNILINTSYSLIAVMLASSLTGIISKTAHIAQFAAQKQIILTLFFFMVFLTGLLLIISGFLKLGRLVKYIPLPVISGLRNGTAILILIMQLPTLLGVEAGISIFNLTQIPDNIQTYVFITGILTLFIIFLTSKYIKKLPPLFPGIIFGCLFYNGLIWLGYQEQFGFIGAVQSNIPQPDYVLHFFQALTNRQLASLVIDLIPTAAGISIILILQTLLASLTADNLMQKRSNTNRELIGQGFANLISALFGGICNSGLMGPTIINHSNGGRTFLSRMITGIFVLTVLFLIGPVMAYVPKVVLAASLCFLAIKLVEPWSLELCKKIINGKSRNKDSYLDLIMILAIISILLFFGALPAVGIGLILSLIHFVYRMTKSNIRREYSAQKINSNVQRVDSELSFLQELGDKITVIELEGTLFFGTADKLVSHIEQLLKKDVDYIILDFAQVTDIDSSGINMLGQLIALCGKKRARLLISGIETKEIIAKYVISSGLYERIEKQHVFDAIDEALGWAEDHLLDDYIGRNRYSEEISLKSITMLSKFTDQDLTILQSYLSTFTSTDGDIIFKQGDQADKLYFLIQGRVNIIIKIPGHPPKVIGNLCRGNIFGEMAIMDGKPRSASVVADGSIKCYTILVEDLFCLNTNHPILSYNLLIGIGLELSKRIRSLNRIISELKT